MLRQSKNFKHQSYPYIFSLPQHAKIACNALKVHCIVRKQLVVGVGIAKQRCTK